MSRTLSSNHENLRYFSDNVVCTQHWLTSQFVPWHQFSASIVPARASFRRIWKMVQIDTINIIDDPHRPGAFTVFFVTSSFDRLSRQTFVCHIVGGQYFLGNSFEENWAWTVDQIYLHDEGYTRTQQYANEPVLKIFLSDLLRAKEVQQQSIMAWIMSARFAPLLISRRDVGFKRSNTRAATAKKRKFQELQETSVFKWVAHPMMDRNLIRLVLSFVR